MNHLEAVAVDEFTDNEELTKVCGRGHGREGEIRSTYV